MKGRYNREIDYLRTEVMESGTEFIGNEISSSGSPEVTASVSDIGHIAKCKATMPKAFVLGGVYSALPGYRSCL